MIINFSPMRSDDTLTLSVSGDVLTVNGEPLDFGPIPVYGYLPKTALDESVSWWFSSDIHRSSEGKIVLTVKLPHTANASYEARFPQPVEVVDGPVTLPE